VSYEIIDRIDEATARIPKFGRASVALYDAFKPFFPNLSDWSELNGFILRSEHVQLAKELSKIQIVESGGPRYLDNTNRFAFKPVSKEQVTFSYQTAAQKPIAEYESVVGTTVPTDFDWTLSCNPMELDITLRPNGQWSTLYCPPPILLEEVRSQYLIPVADTIALATADNVKYEIMSQAQWDRISCYELLASKMGLSFPLGRAAALVSRQINGQQYGSWVDPKNWGDKNAVRRLGQPSYDFSWWIKDIGRHLSRMREANLAPWEAQARLGVSVRALVRGPLPEKPIKTFPPSPLLDEFYQRISQSRDAILGGGIDDSLLQRITTLVG
jgi:hypothetical protein